MNIEHVALWTADIEQLKTFYERYFFATSNNKYTNSQKGFSSYFLSFDSGARLEIMQQEGISSRPGDETKQRLGYAHLAMALGSRGSVDVLTKKLKADGYRILDGPRTTGDGYYESVVLDPAGNRIELTV